jgi:hypothetical protein
MKVCTETDNLCAKCQIICSLRFSRIIILIVKNNTKVKSVAMLFTYIRLSNGKNVILNLFLSIFLIYHLRIYIFLRVPTVLSKKFKLYNFYVFWTLVEFP